MVLSGKIWYCQLSFFCKNFNITGELRCFNEIFFFEKDFIFLIASGEFKRSSPPATRMKKT